MSTIPFNPDPQEEEIRLQNATQVMYGNLDKHKVFPFDVRMRFKYLIYHEAIGVTEDGQTFSKKATRRFSFYSPERFDELVPKSGKSWFELQGKSFTILHDPIAQAKLENRTIDGYYAARTGSSLSEKLSKAVDASSFGATSKQEENEGLQEEKEVVGKKRPALRKEVVE